MVRCMRILLAAWLVLFAAACGAAQNDTADPGIGFGHVHGVDVNPADGLVYAATHHGVFRLGADGPTRIADRYQDTMGFTITGPDRFLGSGHPDLREPGPPQLGLILSTDAARSWRTLSRRGESDFHALSAAGTTVYGWDSTTQTILRSDDDGISWHRGATSAVRDLDVDPGQPMHLLVATETGLLESTNGGITLTPLATQPPQPLVLIDHVSGPDRQPVLAGADSTGGFWSLTNSGWTNTGALFAPPQAFTVVGPDRYVAATAAGVFASQDGGRGWTLLARTTG